MTVDFNVNQLDEDNLTVTEDDLSDRTASVVATASEDDLTSSEGFVVDESEASDSLEYTEWQKPEEFTEYIVASARKLPPVYEGSPNALRRTQQYLKNVQAELINGVEQDAPYAELSEEQLRTLDSVEEGIEKSLEQIANVLQSGLVKKATKSSGFVYYVNPFIFGLARILVNAKVSQGKNIETLYAKMNDRYKLSDRERLELHFVLNDMGHVVRSSPVNHEDMAETYFA